jgi:hypothetical protein
MSRRIICEKCGGWKDIPAFEGDGVYTDHVCSEHFDTDINVGTNWQNVRLIVNAEEWTDD